MYPHERALVKKLADKPFAIIGVNSDADLDEIRRIVKEKNITWRSFWNGPDGRQGPIAQRWNIAGWPTIYILDANGVIRLKQLGADQQPLDDMITQLLGEMGHEVDLQDLPPESGEETEGSGT